MAVRNKEDINFYKNLKNFENYIKDDKKQEFMDEKEKKNDLFSSSEMYDRTLKNQQDSDSNGNLETMKKMLENLKNIMGIKSYGILDGV